jgi:hypothetical protein
MIELKAFVVQALLHPGRSATAAILYSSAAFFT